MNIIEKQPASRFLWALVTLFILLGLGYSTLTPIFENSDETLHYPYVKHLADGQGLPQAVAKQLWNQEGTQHPLYYAIVAASTFWLNTGNLPDLLQRNPHWLFSEVRALINDNQNLVLHGPMDNFPYQRAALAVHMGRWWSLFFGVITVICTFFLAQHLFPQNLPLISTATALTALNPQFIRVSTTVSNDSLAAALTTLTVLLALKFTQPNKFIPRLSPSSFIPSISLRTSLPPSSFPVLLGLLTGLVLLTKLNGLTTLFLIGFIVFWRLFFLGEQHQAPFKTVIRWLIIIAVITLALTSWWFWRNYQLYGEWFATETHLNLAGRAGISLSHVWALRHEAERAFWATFGWGQIRPPEWVYQLFFWFSRIALLGLMGAMLAKIIQGDKRRPVPLNTRLVNFENLVILLLWAGMNLMLYLRWVMEVGSVSHTRLMFPAIAAISLLLAIGWHALIPAKLAGWFGGLVTALLLASNIYALGWLIYPAFTPNAAAAPLTLTSLTFIDKLQLTGGQVDTLNQSTPKPQAGQGDTVLVSAGWTALAPMDKNYSVAVALLDPNGHVLAQRETYPGLGLRPTRYLTPGDSFVDVYPLQLKTDVAVPMVARATVSVFDFESDTRAGLPALDAAGNEVTPVVAHLKIVPQIRPAYTPQNPVRVNFDNTIELIGYDLAGSNLTLYWRSIAPLNDDVIVFIHLLDAAGITLAQADAPPTNNAYPTSWWSPGEVIADSHPLPPNTPASKIRLGLYHLDSGQRLAIIDSTLPAQDHGVEIKRP